MHSLWISTPHDFLYQLIAFLFFPNNFGLMSQKYLDFISRQKQSRYVVNYLKVIFFLFLKKVLLFFFLNDGFDY